MRGWSAMITGKPVIAPAGPPRIRERQLPLDNDIVSFPPR
jgi:hypothetical protein